MRLFGMVCLRTKPSRITPMKEKESIVEQVELGKMEEELINVIIVVVVKQESIINIKEVFVYKKEDEVDLYLYQH